MKNLIEKDLGFFCLPSSWRKSAEEIPLDDVPTLLADREKGVFNISCSPRSWFITVLIINPDGDGKRYKLTWPAKDWNVEAMAL